MPWSELDTTVSKWNNFHCDLNGKLIFKKWIQCMGANNSFQIVWNWLWRNALTPVCVVNSPRLCRSTLYIDSRWLLLNKVYRVYVAILLCDNVLTNWKHHWDNTIHLSCTGVFRILQNKALHDLCPPPRPLSSLWSSQRFLQSLCTLVLVLQGVEWAISINMDLESQPSLWFWNHQEPPQSQRFLPKCLKLQFFGKGL